MKKYLLLICCILTASSFYAFRPSAGGDFDYTEDEEATHIPAMIQVTDGDIDEIIADLELQGIIILRHRGNIILSLIPVDSPSLKHRAKGIDRIEISKPRRNRPLMREARLFNNANYINEGHSLPQPYNGKGVVVGVCDIGMDTRHPNFLDENGNECRIRRVVHYKEQQGLRTV